MLKKLTYSLLLIALFLLIAQPASSAIKKVGKKYNFISFYSGYSKPIGSYDGLTWDDFRVADAVDADEIYDPTFHLGFKYGSVIKGKYSVELGFRYTKHNLLDTVYIARDVLEDDGFYYDYFLDYSSLDPKMNQFDFELDFNYLFLDLDKNLFTPYVGLGAKLGITNTRFNGLFYDEDSDIYLDFEDENDFTYNLNLNFGAEFKIWQNANKPAYVTLASINSIDLLSNDNKPRYINIGGAIKYYFRN